MTGGHHGKGKARAQQRAVRQMRNGCPRLPAYSTRDAAVSMLPRDAPGTGTASIRYCRHCRKYHIYIPRGRG